MLACFTFKENNKWLNHNRNNSLQIIFYCAPDSYRDG